MLTSQEAYERMPSFSKDYFHFCNHVTNCPSQFFYAGPNAFCIIRLQKFSKMTSLCIYNADALVLTVGSRSALWTVKYCRRRSLLLPTKIFIVGKLNRTVVGRRQMRTKTDELCRGAYPPPCLPPTAAGSPGERCAPVVGARVLARL